MKRSTDNTFWRTAAQVGACCACLLGFTTALQATEPLLPENVKSSQPAKVKVSGFGLLRNREMRRLLQNFQPDGKFPETLTRNFVEDAALVLFSRANNQGYLRATLETSYLLADGSRQRNSWTNALDVNLPRDLSVTEVQFKIHKGKRFYYRNLQIKGITALTGHEAAQYYVGSDTLLNLRGNRLYHPDLLNSSTAALIEALARKGYGHARVKSTDVQIDEASGAVDALIEVVEGLPTIVRMVTVDVEMTNDDSNATQSWVLKPEEPYSRIWAQNLTRRLREQQYAVGFPDAAASLSELASETNRGVIFLDLAAEVIPGPRIKLGQIKYSGNHRTRAAVLQSRVDLEPGDWLDRIEAERSRQRLARLGAFDSVSLEYEQADETTRDLHYQFSEGKRETLSLLAGYGSYELLRGGVEFEHRNMLGLAHDFRLRAIQSFKSTSGDVQYTVPELVGENIDAFVKGSGLRREELTFTREEYGGSAGLRRYLEGIKTDASLHYDYEFLNASDIDASTNATGVTDARSAAVVLDLNHDNRQSPLLPETGLKLLGKFEAASQSLGGNVDYQRFIVGGSYHLDLRGGRLLHLALIQGVSFTWGGSNDDLPFTKRFFPGGESSVRGYQQGEASPVDSAGNQLGAETYTQGNVELEQLLTDTWALVVFFDAVGFAEDRSNYPWDQGLYSVGGGIRWRSIIGPVRLEYGHNLNPRPDDPSGTLHFSIGFPF